MYSLFEIRAFQSCAMIWAVCYRHFTADYRFRSQVNTRGKEISFSPSTSVSVSIIPILIHSYTCCSYQKDKRAKPGSRVLSERERWVEKYFHFFVL